jgi:putative redox protein
VDLTWLGALKFSATINAASFTLDSAGVDCPSPVGALAAALAGCMSIDLVHILTRGRHPLRAVSTRLVGDRAHDDPHRLTRVTLHVTIDGDVADEPVARALRLSHDKYCSVWHSLRQDIEFITTHEIRR